jgi:uncharacterized protein (TIGR02246 family)
MHTRLFLITVMLIALILAGCAKQEVAKGPSLAEDTAALKALVQSDYVRAYNTRNFASLARLYTEDAVRMPDNMPAVTGKEAIMAGYQKVFEDYATAVINQTADEIAVSGDWAHVRGAYHWSGTPQAGGQPVETRGKWLAVYQRQPDGWKLSRTSWNSDQPPPPPAK